MNIPPFMSIRTDPSEVIDVELRVCWRRAGWLHVTAVIPSRRHEVWPFPEAALPLRPPSEGRIDLWRAKQTARPLLYISQSRTSWIHGPRACDPVLGRWALCCAPPSRALPLSCLSAGFWTGPGAVWPGASVTLRKTAKWHPGGNQKHALASLSLVLEII